MNKSNVPRSWVEIFSPLLEKFNLDYHGLQKSNIKNNGITETDKFIVYPFSEEDIECNCNRANCLCAKPNFFYKPTDFKIWWYKYPMRGAEMSPEISTEEFMKIVLDCMEE